jgi:transglutaminase-like putative cysteine protease
MAGSAAGALRTVRCEVGFEVSEAAAVVAQVAVAGSGAEVLTEELEVLSSGAPVPAEELVSEAGRQHLIDTRPGPLTIRYAARLTPGQPVPAPVTPSQRVVAMRPSRYCPSDRLVGFAYQNFAPHPGRLARVRAICEYVAEHVSYEPGASDPTTDAADTLLTGQGVCRDFAHLVAALCRAVEVPARIAAVYAPGMHPMDFHLVVETDIDGVWRVWDATRLAPRTALIRIATGRDAADVAFSTVLSGRAEPTGLQVTAVVDGDLPGDDHRQLCSLG